MNSWEFLLYSISSSTSRCSPNYSCLSKYLLPLSTPYLIPPCASRILRSKVCTTTHIMRIIFNSHLLPCSSLSAHSPLCPLLSSCCQRIFFFLGHLSPREPGHWTCKSSVLCFPSLPGRWQSVASALSMCCHCGVCHLRSPSLLLSLNPAQFPAWMKGTDGSSSAACK